MIFIPRGPAPEFLNSKEAADAFKARDAHFSTLGKLKGQSRYEDKYYNSLLVRIRPNLTEQFKHKCCYCESPVWFDGERQIKWLEDKVFPVKANVETFRTLNNAMNLDGQESPGYYWWLAYDWRNYYLSCQECNTFKKSFFPVEGERAAIKASYEELQNEKYLLVDPCQPAVHLHFDFKSDGSIVPRSKKGEVTIKLLNLNRARLNIDRRTIYNETIYKLMVFFDNYDKAYAYSKNTENTEYSLHRDDIQELYESIVKINSGILYQAVQRQALKDFLIDRVADFRSIVKHYFDENPLYDIDESMAEFHADLFSIGKGQKKKREHTKQETNDYVESNIGEETFSRRVFLNRIELKNFKGFDTLDIPVSRSSEPGKEAWLLFLGENGVGKSTVTLALALALAGQTYLDEIVKEGLIDARKLIKNGKPDAYIRVYTENRKEPYEVIFNRKKGEIKSNIPYPATYLSGYGSTRLMPTRNIQAEVPNATVKLKNMLDYSFSLYDAEQWFKEIPHTKFNKVALALKDLLRLDNNEVEIKLTKGKLELTKHGETNTLEAMSDGYKSVIALAADIMRTYDDRNISFENAEGVVLIDEIGTHLHPQWRMKVAGDLRRAFPNIQFIVTTHEPLCLRGLNKGEIVALLRNKDNEVIPVKDELPDPATMRVDQLLTSEFFGLSSTLDPALEEELFYYYQLKAKETRTADEEVAYNDLKAKVSGLSLLGNSRLESIYHKVAQEKASTRWTDEGKLKNTEAVNADIKTLITDLWDELDN